jgi:hypothetical protein
MRASRLLILLALPAAALPLGACATDGYGYGGGGFAYEAGWGDPYWGWYGDYYYPGTGIYVYDSGRHRHRWNDAQRRYWGGRRGGWRGPRNTVGRSNWHDFRRGDHGRPSRGHQRGPGHRGGH